jgi:hypothetical protein
MAATNILFGNNRTRPQTPSGQNNQPYTVSSNFTFDNNSSKKNSPIHNQNGSKPPTPSNNSEVRIVINDPQVLQLPELPNNTNPNNS